YSTQRGARSRQRVHRSAACRQMRNSKVNVAPSPAADSSSYRLRPVLNRKQSEKASAFDRLKGRCCRSESSAVLPQILAEFLWCNPYRLHCPLQSRRFDAERLCPLLQFTLSTGGLLIRFLLRLRLVTNHGHGLLL